MDVRGDFLGPPHGPTSNYVQLNQTIIQLASSSGDSVQSRSRLKAMKTPPPWLSPTLSFRIASKESGKISEFLISGVNHDSVIPQDDVWFCRVNNSMKFSPFIIYRLTIHNQDSERMIQDRLFGL